MVDLTTSHSPCVVTQHRQEGDGGGYAYYNKRSFSPRPSPFPANFKYLNLPIEDIGHVMSFDHIDLVIAFVAEQIRADRAVLLHCEAGMSRSPTMVMAYLVKELGLSCHQADAHVRAVRPSIHPNLGFCQLLWDYRQHSQTVDDKQREESEGNRGDNGNDENASGNDENATADKDKDNDDFDSFLVDSLLRKYPSIQTGGAEGSKTKREIHEMLLQAGPGQWDEVARQVL